MKTKLNHHSMQDYFVESDLLDFIDEWSTGIFNRRGNVLRKIQQKTGVTPAQSLNIWKSFLQFMGERK